MKDSRKTRCGVLAGWILWALGCGVLGCGAGCGKPADEPEELRIGVLVETTHLEGEPAFKAARLAVERLEEQGGLVVNGRRHPVRLIERSDHETPDEAVAAARELIYQEDVSVLVAGYLSRDAIPVAAVAESAGVPMVTPGSTLPQTTAGKRYVFRVVYVDTFQAQVLARFVVQDLGLETVAILYNVTDVYSRGLAKIFSAAAEELGGRTVAEETFTPGDLDFRAQLERICLHRPQALFLPNYTDVVGIQARQARELGLDAVLVGGDSWTAERLVGVAELQGAYVVHHWHPDLAERIPEARVFQDAYRARYGEDPFAATSLMWDSLGLIFQAATHGTDPETIRDALAETVDYRGATGSITFAGHGGDAARSAVILKIEGGRLELERLVEP